MIRLCFDYFAELVLKGLRIKEKLLDSRKYPRETILDPQNIKR